MNALHLLSQGPKTCHVTALPEFPTCLQKLRDEQAIAPLPQGFGWWGREQYHQPAQQASSSNSSAANGAGGTRQGQVGCSLAVKGAGALVMYSSRAPAAVYVDSQAAPFQYDPVQGKLEVRLEARPQLHHSVLVEL